MGLLKKLVKEKKLCKVFLNGEVELDEWLVVDLNTSHYVVCETTTRWSCWVVPKPLFNTFMRQFYHHSEKFEVPCS